MNLWSLLARGLFVIILDFLFARATTVVDQSRIFSATPAHATVLNQLRTLLNEGHEAGIHALSASQFELNDAYYGPVQLECAELLAVPEETSGNTDDLDIKTVLSWSAPGWAPEGIDAGLSIRSITKFFVNAVLLELERSGSGPKRSTRLVDYFPECKQEGNLLLEATVEQLMNMQTNLDHRTSAFFSSDNIHFPEGRFSAPTTHPCELASMSHAECVRKLICPAYSHIDVYEAVRMNPKSFGDNGSFVLTKAHFKDNRCANDSVNFENNCSRWALYGVCNSNPAFMLSKCPTSCRLCDFLSTHDNSQNLCKDSPGCADIFAGKIGKSKFLACAAKNYSAVRDCPETCRICQQMRAHAHLRSVYHAESGNSSSHIKKLRLEAVTELVYDNDSYVILEAILKAMSGKSVADWILQLIAAPLDLNSILRCLRDGETNEKGVSGCYRRSTKGTGLLTMTASDLQMSVGVESPITTGTNLIASTHDVLKFALVLLSNYGRIGNIQYFSKKTAEIFRHSSELLAQDETMEAKLTRQEALQTGNFEVPGRSPKCQTFSLFRHGLGYNLSGDFYSWGSTYGSRLFVFPREFPQPSGACMIHARMPLGGRDTPNSVGFYSRYASRQHYYTYKFADAMLQAWPPASAGTQEPRGNDIRNNLEKGEIDALPNNRQKKKKKKKKKKKRGRSRELEL